MIDIVNQPKTKKEAWDIWREFQRDSLIIRLGLGKRIEVTNG